MEFCQEARIKGALLPPIDFCMKIHNSRTFCGISVTVDGTEDDQIHCLKPGGVTSEAAPELSQLTTEMLACEDDDEADDPFLSEDEDKLDTNELVVDDGKDIA